MDDTANAGATPKIDDTPAAPSVAAQIVEDWKAAHLRNSPFSRNTAAWNTLEKALPALIAAFEEVL